MIRVLDSAGSTLVEWGRQQQQQQRMESRLMALLMIAISLADIVVRIFAKYIFMGLLNDINHYIQRFINIVAFDRYLSKDGILKTLNWFTYNSMVAFAHH